MMRRQAFSLETLEDRRMMAVDILADIEVEGDARFIPRDLTGFNGSVYMRLSDNRFGPEPWISQGSPESTQLLRDIRVGNFGSGARDFAEYDGRLFFGATNGFSGLELWVTQGTKATTQLVSDIWPGSENGAPTDFIVFNDLLYFFANDGETGRELYQSDGTSIGTFSVGDVIPGGRGASGTDLMQIGKLLFFRSETTADGQAGIWISDGTGPGTQRVPIPGIAGENIDLMTPHGTQLVFASAEQLWISDGTAEGSGPIAPTGDPIGTSFRSIVSLGDRLFVADERGLHELSGDLSVSRTITPLADGVATSDGNVYFWNSGGVFAIAGTADPVMLVSFNPQFGSKVGTTDAVPGGFLFNVNRALNRWEIWATDGTPAGTSLLERVTEDSAEPFLEFQQIGDLIYFTATNGNFHQSVWTIPAPIFETATGLPGDVNRDDVVDALDVDALYGALRDGSDESIYDVNEDDAITSADVDYLIHDILQTRRGDLNLDGHVDFADFLKMSGSFGALEAVWADGDTDGDGTVGFADFLVLSGNFGFSSETPGE